MLRNKKRYIHDFLPLDFNMHHEKYIWKRNIRKYFLINHEHWCEITWDVTSHVKWYRRPRNRRINSIKVSYTNLGGLKKGILLYKSNLSQFSLYLDLAAFFCILFVVTFTRTIKQHINSLSETFYGKNKLCESLLLPEYC